jgi:hypothetical protein
MKYSEKIFSAWVICVVTINAALPCYMGQMD